METLRDRRCQPRLLYPANFSVMIDEKSKIVHDQVKYNYNYLQIQPTEGVLRKLPNQRG